MSYAPAKPNAGETPQHHRASVGTSVLVNVTGHEYHEIEIRRNIGNFNPGEEALIDEVSLVIVAQ